MKERNVIKLPIFGQFVLRFLLPGYDYEYVIGVYEQGFQDQKGHRGIMLAWVWFWGEVLNSTPILLKQKMIGGFAMVKSYFNTSLRNLNKSKGFSIINISGLAIGMACCLLIMLWVHSEMSYDNFHRDGDRIFRILTDIHSQGKITKSAGAPAPLGDTLVKELPEVEKSVLVQSGWDGWQLHYNDKWFFKEKLAAVGPSFFEVFDFEFSKGDPKSVLKDKKSVVISESIARKCFGNEDPLGKIMKISDTDMMVTGVIKSPPKNSHIQFDYAFSAENMRQWRSSQLDSWEYLQFATYIRLHPEAKVDEVTEKINQIVRGKIDKMEVTFRLQPLKDIHLRSSGYNAWMVVYGETGNIMSVYIFSFIAFSILLLACINFMNLTTARSARRLQEVGIRKVSGAHRYNVFSQFMGESSLLSLLAMGVGIGLILVILPSFNQLVGKDLSLFQGGSGSMVLMLLGVTLLTGILSGSYPALVMSRFKPIHALKGSKADRYGSGNRLRQILVVVQFTFTIGLIIISVVVYRQMNFIRHKDLGYNQEHVITTWSGHSRIEVMIEKLKKNPNIIEISQCQAPRADLYGRTGYNWEGAPTGAEDIMFYPIGVDYNYLKVFEIRMASGRFYDKEFPTDQTDGVVINETAAGITGLADPIGKRITRGEWSRTIIGVVRDFHMTSLHNPIEPLIFAFADRTPHMSARISPNDVSATMSYWRSVWDEMVTDYPFEYSFLDNTINNFYQKDKKTATLILYATVLAMAIALLGLFGLAAHAAEQRTKEIGIRKVMGASVPEIIRLLVRETVYWFILSTLIAWPIGYFVAAKWIHKFAYYQNLTLWIFFLSSVIALSIALATIVFQVVRAASRNPIKSLRYE